MNLLFVTLDENAKTSVDDILCALPSRLHKIYCSPNSSTVVAANLLKEKFFGTEIVTDHRISEINYGKLSASLGNEKFVQMMDESSSDDYFIHIAQYGENRFDIEMRLVQFLGDVYKNNFPNSTVVIMTNSFIALLLKRILKIDKSETSFNCVEAFEKVDSSPLNKHIKKLRDIQKKEVQHRMKMVEELNVNDELKNNLLKIAKQEFNNIEFCTEEFEKFISGLKTKNLLQKSKATFSEGPIVVCFYNNFENFAEKWMQHYISIGVENFVMIDNYSTDQSTKILETYLGKVNISFWQIHEKYDCNKMCGWRQQIFEFYGKNNLYITVDSDELLIYKDYKHTNFKCFSRQFKNLFLKGIMIDVYTKKSIGENCTLSDFLYADKNTYKKCLNASYGERFYGGPRERMFGIRPSLQKIPVMFYTGREVFANDHFYYPWNINKKAKLNVFLLHYKFLPGDLEKYREFAEDGRHWNNSREYKVYNNVIKKNEKAFFYCEGISILIEDLPFLT